MKYEGQEKGSSVLNLSIDQALIFDGKHYETFKIPYLEKYDTKKKNVSILVPKKVQKKVEVKNGWMVVYNEWDNYDFN